MLKDPIKSTSGRRDRNNPKTSTFVNSVLDESTIESLIYKMKSGMEVQLVHLDFSWVNLGKERGLISEDSPRLLIEISDSIFRTRDTFLKFYFINKDRVSHYISIYQLLLACIT